MLRTGVVVSAVGSALLAAAASAAEHDWDAEADFTAYHSFAWAEERGARPARRGGAAPPAWSSIGETDVQRAVETELVAKGLERKAAPREADLVVVFHVGTEVERVGTWYRTGPRLHRWRRGVRTYTENVLTIDLVDRARRELVWRGWEDATIKDDPEARKAQIEKLVRKILKAYPPGRG